MENTWCLYLNVKSRIYDNHTELTLTVHDTHAAKQRRWEVPAPQLQHTPLTLSLQGLLGVLLGEGEADRLRLLLTLSQIHPPSLAPQVLRLTPRSTLPTKLWARSSGEIVSRAVGSERDGYSSSWGRTRQCREDRQLPGLKPPPPPAAPLPPLPSQLSSSEGADKKVVQNIILAAEWAWAVQWEQAWMETPRKILIKQMKWMQICGSRNVC